MKRHLRKIDIIRRAEVDHRNAINARRSWYVRHNQAIEYANQMIQSHSGSFILYYDSYMECSS